MKKKCILRSNKILSKTLMRCASTIAIGDISYRLICALIEDCPMINKMKHNFTF